MTTEVYHELNNEGKREQMVYGRKIRKRRVRRERSRKKRE